MVWCRWKWLCGSTLLGMCLVALLQSPGAAQPSQDAALDEALPAPRAVPKPPETATQFPPADVRNPAVGITYLDALRIAVLSNLSVAQAQAVVRQAQAAKQRAEVVWLPNLNTLPFDYVNHQGRIQQTAGNIIKVDRESLLVATGPVLSLGLSDAIFNFGVARQNLLAARAGQQRVTNDTMLAVSDAYFNVLRNRRRVARLDEVLEFLTSEQPRAIRSNLRGMLPLMTAYLEAGATSQAEHYRVEVEVLRRRQELITAIQDLRVSIAELARLLHQDPTVVLWPLEDYRVPVPIPGEGWFNLNLPDLVRTALNNRPELAEQQALVQAAVNQVKAAKYRPFFPTLLVTYSDGGFGGGPRLVTTPGVSGTTFGHSGNINDFGNRTDFEAGLVWQLQNMGFGNLATVRQNQAVQQREQFRLIQLRDFVVADVVQAQEQIRRGRERLAISQGSLFDRKGAASGVAYESIRLNFLRLSKQETRPLEVLDSIRSLNDLLDVYIQDMTDYERARFRLLVALGIPKQALMDPSLMPVPPAARAPEAAPVPAPVAPPAAPRQP
ncbi:MAG TPA: TolC family protein [Gemmataceae bacterium]